MQLPTSFPYKYGIFYFNQWLSLINVSEYVQVLFFNVHKNLFEKIDSSLGNVLES